MRAGRGFLVAGAGTLVAPLALLVACTGTPARERGTSAQGGTGGTASAGSGPGGGGAGGAAVGGGLPTPTLVDRGLVARYFIDEADSGQGPAELQDAAPDPLPLELTYVPEMQFVEDAGHRGIRFEAIELDGRADVLVDATKIQQRLIGSTEGTIEVVVEIHDVSSSHSRLVHIGEGSESGWFTLNSPNLNALRFYTQGSSHNGEFHAHLPGYGRMVLHLVMDTALDDAATRVRCYLNAAPTPVNGGLPPAKGAVLDIPLGRHFAIANRHVGSRTIEGTIYYAAIYDVALAEAEVLQNTQRLLDDDDGP